MAIGIEPICRECRTLWFDEFRDDPTLKFEDWRVELRQHFRAIAEDSEAIWSERETWPLKRWREVTLVHVAEEKAGRKKKIKEIAEDLARLLGRHGVT